MMMTWSTTRYRRREGLVDEEGQRLVVEGERLVVEEDRVVHVELASSPCLVVLFVSKLGCCVGVKTWMLSSCLNLNLSLYYLYG